MLTHDLSSIPQYARKVEAMGYDCLWSSETQHDPYLPLAVAATTTERIKLGTAIAVAFPRSPMITAYIAWDLQKASGGRMILGLGSQVKGHNERRFSVKFESPGPKLREQVLAIRTIWNCWQTGAKLDFKGEFYRFDLMTPMFNPGPIEHPRIPIYISGVNAYMCRVAGDWKGMADLITDEMVDTYAVTGTYATIGQKIRERYAGLLDRTALYQTQLPNLDDPRLVRLVKEFNQ